MSVNEEFEQPLRPDASSKRVDPTAATLLVVALVALVMPLMTISLILAAVCLVGAILDLQGRRGSLITTGLALLASVWAISINPLVLGALANILGSLHS